MAEYTFSRRWILQSASTPEQMWPVLSDTNRLFRDLGQLPIEKASLSHGRRKGYKELTYEPLHRTDMWEEEPFQWEAPYHFSVRRNYKSGYLSELNISFELRPDATGSTIHVRFSGIASGLTGYLFAKKTFNSRFRFKLKKLLNTFDEAIAEKRLPRAKKHLISIPFPKRWDLHRERLADLSGEPELARLLVDNLKKGHVSDLNRLSPIRLAKVWGKPLRKVTELMFFAAKLDLLNFGWNVICPECQEVVKHSKKLSGISDPVYCKQCETDFNVDFHQSIELNFQPHPLVRKLQRKIYCLDSPSYRPGVLMNVVLKPGQKRFVQLKLSVGTYRFHSSHSDECVIARADDEGMENVTLHFRKKSDVTQHVNLSKSPNLIIHNQSDEEIIVQCENLSREEYSISPAIVTSWQTFRNLFPRELIRPKKRFHSSNLTILFTDLYNSSNLYRKGGDESALGLVMNHFDILEKAIIDQRGSVVKTIGDSVMAIFPKPVYALKAFHKAEELLSSQKENGHAVELKGGIHTGDCMAVTLNNRIDYFGNSVNIASRLADSASSGQIVISANAYQCPDLHSYVSVKRDQVHIHTADITLRGFDNESFEIISLSRRNNAMRLVI
jgi:adenylate cyclase